MGPMAGVTITFIYMDDRNKTYKTVTDSEGAFELTVPISKGDCRILFEKEYCGKAILHDHDVRDSFGKIPVKMSLTCSDPPLPIMLKEHKSNPGVSYKKYIGSYQFESISKSEKKTDGTIYLIDEIVSPHEKYKFSPVYKVAIRGKNGESFGCWYVQENGDIVISFSCGNAFAGEKITLWEDGDRLVGYGVSRNDVGPGHNREIILTPIKK